MNIGLRIDVDTLRGTQKGVPTLVRILAKRGITATFFFSVGPDNMGRHLWRIIKPAFAWKMMRTRAASLYGWDILLKGTLWPGPLIGEKCRDQVRQSVSEGHEIGLHAWDHHAWQVHLDDMPAEAIKATVSRGVDALTDTAGVEPTCSAVPGWRCNDQALQVFDDFGFLFGSDCRGHSPYFPIIGQRSLWTPQIPVTLPTFDELVGRGGVTPENYNEILIKHLDPERLNVLAIHAEVEGMSCKTMFEDFIDRTTSMGARIVPLSKFVSETHQSCPMVSGTVSGREGTLAAQGITRETVGERKDQAE